MPPSIAPVGMAFLDLLKRTRLRQPLNGVIVAISLTEIAAAPRDERLAHARAIRRRLQGDRGDGSAIRLPVYAVFTKADLLAGFTEFFDDLDREKRGQVWGATFPLATRDAGPIGGLPAEFQLLIERLNSRLFDRLQSERSPPRRSLIAGFAPQVASLEAPLADFLQEAFGGSRLDPAPMLRGFYFTSGTQEGTPIDRLTGVLARSFGMDQRRAPSLRPEQGRSYFLSRLVKEVIFGEAMLVSERPGAARRRLLMRGGAFAGGGARAAARRRVAVASRRAQPGAIRQDGRGARRLREDRRGNEARPGSRGRPAARSADARPGPGLPHGYATDRCRTSARGSLGPLAGSQARGRRAQRLSACARAGAASPPDLAAGKPDAGQHQPAGVPLRSDARLPDAGQRGPLDRDLVRAWMALGMAGHLSGRGRGAAPRKPRPPSRCAARRAAAAVPLDGALIEAARATFSRVPLANRVYSRIAPSAAAQAVAPWRPADAVGAAGAQVFVRASGKKLTDGIPGFYTIDGFYTVLLPALGHRDKAGGK